MKGATPLKQNQGTKDRKQKILKPKAKKITQKLATN